MTYYYLLCIRTVDWDDGVNLCIFDHSPTDDEKKNIIRDYWSQFENGLYERFEEFLEALLEAEKQQTTVYRRGIWTEKLAFIQVQSLK